MLVNHFKSQSGGGGSQRLRQATKVREIADDLVAAGEHVIVVGDLNEGPPGVGQPPPNLARLFDPVGPLVSCYDLPRFDVDSRPGTFAPCGLRDRLDKSCCRGPSSRRSWADASSARASGATG